MPNITSSVNLGGMDTPDELLTIPQISELTAEKGLGREGEGLTVNTLYTYNAGRLSARNRKMPKPDKYVGTVPQWYKSTILEWLEDREENEREEARRREEKQAKYWRGKKKT